MAKRRKILPARPSRDAFDDSLLIRSAESLGRMIGALQREIDAARQLAAARAGTGNGATAARRSVAATHETEETNTKAPMKSAPRATASKTAGKSARSRQARTGRSKASGV